MTISLEERGTRTFKLDGRIRELIAIGASITANCQPCLEYHAGKAREIGANEEQINEAIKVGKMVRGGAAAKMDRFSAALLHAPSPVGASDGDCGSGQ